MASVITKLRPVIVPATHKHTSSLIFLHGSGSNGLEMREWTAAVLNKAFEFPHIRIIYPTAPLRPYTPLLGRPSTVWFDRKQISPLVDDDMESVTVACNDLHELIEEEVKSGIPRERIAIGGFSMGGSLALQYAYGHSHEIAGVFALSAFLGNQSFVYKNLQQSSGSHPPLFQCHGQSDPLVSFKWGRDTHYKLLQHGIDGVFFSLPKVYHELSREMIQKLSVWISTILPE